MAVGGLTFQVLATPGHSAGSVTLRCGDVLLCGDTLFAGSMAAGVLPQPLTGEEVLETAQKAGPRFAALVKGCLDGMEPHSRA